MMRERNFGKVTVGNLQENSAARALRLFYLRNENLDDTVRRFINNS